MTLLRPCLQCGQPSAGSRCPDCQPGHEARRPDFRARYGGNRWDRLSKRARRLQPWCSDCQTTTNLQCDHLPSAWERLAAGKVLRLSDVDVVCGPCNSRRGSSRPGSERARRVALTDQGTDPSTEAARAADEATSRLHTGNHSQLREG